jgi:hypothetical protein
MVFSACSRPSNEGLAKNGVGVIAPRFMLFDDLFMIMVTKYRTNR